MLETLLFWALLSVNSTRSFVNIGDSVGIPVASVYRHADQHQISYDEALRQIRAEHAAKKSS